MLIILKVFMMFCNIFDRCCFVKCKFWNKCFKKVNLWDFDKYFKVFLLYVIRYEYCKLMIGYR